MKRRQLGAVLLAGALTPGCLDLVAGDRAEYEAEPAAVDPRVVDEQGYESEEFDSFTVEEDRDLPVIGERRVVITNHFAAYSKVDVDESALDGADREDVDPAELDTDELDEEEAAVGALQVVSTPKVSVAGQGLNPLGRLPLRELVEEIGDRLIEQSDIEYEGSTEITVLDSETTVEKYSSTTETDEGTRERMYVYVTRVGNEDDYVIAVGLMPQKLDHDEPSLFAMMEGIEHPVSR